MIPVAILALFMGLLMVALFVMDVFDRRAR